MALITPELVLSYPKVFRSELPHDPRPNDKKAWSTAALFSKAATESAEFKVLMAEAFKALKDRWGPSVTSKIQVITQGREAGRAFVTYTDDKNKEQVLYIPFRSDAAAKGYPDWVVSYFSARKVDNPEKNSRAPEVISRSGAAITDPREIYPGVRARLSLAVFTYDNQGNCGVSFGLNNVQKLGEGDRIDGAQAAKDEFGVPPDEPAAPMKDDLAGFVD